MTVISIEQLAALPLPDLLASYRRGDLDPVEVVECFLAQAQRVNPTINALYEMQCEQALAKARASRARWQKRQNVGALDGVPVTLKDSVNACGMHWYHGSSAHGDGRLASEDAPPVERLNAANAIVLAKCTMPDFGMSASGVSSRHGITRNPWNTAASPGGSSSGGAASLAAGVGVASIGSDIAGSVRLPAAQCGLAALKPTQGLMAHTPASDVRSAGLISRHAADLEPLLRAVAGVHPKDRFSLPLVEPDANTLSPRVAVYQRFGFGPEPESAARHAVEQAALALAEMGASVAQQPAPYQQDIYAAIDDTFKLRAWREYASCSPALRNGVPQPLVEWCAPAGGWTLADMADIDTRVQRGVAATNALFDHADFLLTPVTPVIGFRAEQLGPDPKMPLRHCTFTAPFNQSGHPAAVVAATMGPQRQPVGIQLVARRCDDIRLLHWAVRLEAALRRLGETSSWPLSPSAVADATVTNAYDG
ncbi:amidase family protein [Carnimonas bestiolae]|uniref:amidase family protein n=1 Tax=Carnimonas bestiolae TaxID=3402172 RepID=UPI003F4AC0E8